MRLVMSLVLTGLSVGRLLQLRREDLGELDASRDPTPRAVADGAPPAPGRRRADPRLARGDTPGGDPPGEVRLGLSQCGEDGARWVEGATEIPVLGRRHLQRAARAAGVEEWARMTFESLGRFHRETIRSKIEWPPARPEPATSSGQSVLIGDREVIVSSDEQVRVIELLKRESRPLSLAEIGEKAHVKSPRHVLPKAPAASGLRAVDHGGDGDCRTQGLPASIHPLTW